MTTTTLSSRQRFTSLLGHLLRRNLSTSLYLLVIIFVFFPLQMFFETQRELDILASGEAVRWTNVVGASGMYTSVSLACMAGLLLVASLVLGLVQCSYLHNKRAVDLYHSLPVTRTQLMLAGLISSFLTVAVPYVINYILNLGISAYRVSKVVNVYEGDYARLQVIPFGEVTWDILGWLVTIFAILAIVNLVATQVGSMFENFVFVGELLVSPALIMLLNRTLFEQFLVGFASPVSVKTMMSLSPATFMFGRMSHEMEYTYHNIVTIVWLVLGVAIMWAACWMYNRRRSEIAESSGCKGILGLLFSTVAVYLAAPLVGIVVFSAGLDSEEKYVYVLGVVLGAVLSFLLVEAILSRGFAGIRSRLPQGGAVCAFVIAVAVVVTTGGLGYETRLPNADKVDSVTINSRGWYEYAEALEYNKLNGGGASFTTNTAVTLHDKQAVEAVIAMHKRLIAINQAPSTDTDYWADYTLGYTMGGSKMNRRYDRTSNEVDALLVQLEDTEEFQREANPVLRVNPETVTKATLHNNLGFATGALVTQPDIKALLDALGKDSLEQGTAPYVGGERVLCYVHFTTPYMRGYYSDDYPPQDEYYNSFSMPVFASYKHTLAQLGANLPKQATAADVTELGLGTYYSNSYYGSNRNDRFISQASSRDDRNANKNDIEAYTKRQDKIAQVIERMQTTAFVGKGNSYEQPLYCTFINGSEQGITVMIPNDAIPEDIFDEFPDLAERYQEQKDAAIAESVIETVNAVALTV